MSLYLRKDTGKWIVVFYDENGKRRQRSFDTGENGRKAAEAFDVQMKNRKINSIQGPSVEGEDLDGAGQVEASTDADNQSGPTDTVKSIPSTTGQQAYASSKICESGANAQMSVGPSDASVPNLSSKLMYEPKPEQVQHRKSYAGADPKVIKYLNLWDMYKHNPDPTAPITMGELIGEYVRHMWVNGCSYDYVKSMSTVAKKVFLPFFGDTSNIKSIDYARHIVPFFEMLRLHPSRLGKIRKNQTVNGYGRYLKAIFNYAIRCEYIDKSPMRMWKPLKEVKVDRELTYEDGFKIMKHCLPHVRWALELICVTGIRPGKCELFSLEWKDVDFENNRIKIYSTKTNTTRFIYFKDDFREKLLQHKKEAKSDFVVEYKGKRVRTIKRNFSLACERANITYHVRPYDFRHLFATYLLNKGADLAAVSKLLGHAKIMTTVSSYYETKKAEVERAISLIPSIPDD